MVFGEEEVSGDRPLPLELWQGKLFGSGEARDGIDTRLNEHDRIAILIQRIGVEVDDLTVL